MDRQNLAKVFPNTRCWQNVLLFYVLLFRATQQAADIFDSDEWYAEAAAVEISYYVLYFELYEDAR